MSFFVVHLYTPGPCFSFFPPPLPVLAQLLLTTFLPIGPLVSAGHRHPVSLLSFPWGFSSPYCSLLPSSLTYTHTHCTLFRGLCKIWSTKPHVL